MHKLNRSQRNTEIMKALNLEQHVHINTAKQKILKGGKNKVTYVFHSSRMGASHLTGELGSVPLFKRSLVF